MTAKPETLRAYATILESHKRGIDNRLRPPSEVCLAAAEALRFQATHIEHLKRDIEPLVPM